MDLRRSQCCAVLTAIHQLGLLTAWVKNNNQNPVRSAEISSVLKSLALAPGIMGVSPLVSTSLGCRSGRKREAKVEQLCHVSLSPISSYSLFHQHKHPIKHFQSVFFFSFNLLLAFLFYFFLFICIITLLRLGCRYLLPLFLFIHFQPTLNCTTNTSKTSWSNECQG